ncbi:type I polyketide synthase [Parendozoicomonas haliclonae]|uniref:Phenolphthiocerol synthesis polyketide synthase type I Pks15/1 n=1 Tax=Parendozoicomonas haliclonae TaxID=1960125 RepID=A0A1X7AG39_9GAMM|nr:Phenolphthiocerol synthesis polyketide synthase type I Pks15/1 [Parendozoicomonas haliclonae]
MQFASTLARTRSTMPWQALFFAGDREELINLLEVLSSQPEDQYPPELRVANQPIYPEDMAESWQTFLQKLNPGNAQENCEALVQRVFSGAGLESEHLYGNERMNLTGLPLYPLQTQDFSPASLSSPDADVDPGVDTNSAPMLYSISWQPYTSATPDQAASEIWYLHGTLSARLKPLLSKKGQQASLIEQVGDAFSDLAPTGHLLISLPETEPALAQVWEYFQQLQGIGQRLQSGQRACQSITLLTGGSEETLSDTLISGLLGGLLPSLKKEWPDLPIRLLQLGSSWDIDSQKILLWSALCGSASSPMVLRLRGDQLQAMNGQVINNPAESQSRSHSTRSGSIVITGAFGGMGQYLVSWAIKQDYQRIVLLSRNSQSDANQCLLARWKEQVKDDCVLVALTGDVSDDRLPEQLLAACDGYPLSLIIHGAGVLRDALFENQTKDDWQAVTGAKVEGALMLTRLQALSEGERANKECHLLLCSSVCSLVGNVGQTVYGAANGGLDGLAEYLSANGHSAVSINWGIWQGTGMVRDAASELSGVLPSKPEQMLAALDRCLIALEQGNLPSHLAIARFTDEQPFQALLGPQPQNIEPAREVVSDHTLQTDLANCFLDQATALLGLERQELTIKDALFDRGLTSLTAVELANRVGQAFGLTIPPAWVIGSRNIEALSRRLVPLAQATTRTAKSPETLQSQPEPAQPKEVLSTDTIPPGAIAIIGASCRLPGNVDSLDDLWRLLEEGRDTVGDIPADRWDSNSHYDPEGKAPGNSWCRRGSFIENPEMFDAAFFGISPREAEKLDPMQRLLLEQCWHALEHAGLSPDHLEGTRTGVYIGIGSSDYHERLVAENAVNHSVQDTYDLTGSQQSFSAGRLSWHLGLQGPSLTVETACSSSLVALHLAVQALRGGECDQALVAGVQLMFNPDHFVTLTHARTIAPDGLCKAFAENADGYGRGEGCAVVVLRRADLVRSDHPILTPMLAMIRGSAINHDGRSNGLTVPCAEAQELVCREALVNSGLSPADIHYIEAHGTGTALGDPIEASALQTVYGEGRDIQSPLWLGTVKANLGHLEAGAGLAGVLKVLVMFRNQRIPGQIHCQPLSQRIDWKDGLQVPTVSQPLPQPARTGVSSFGMSGTNAHIILESAQASEELQAGGKDDERPWPLIFSARSQNALKDLLQQYATLAGDIGIHARFTLRDLCWNLAQTRALLKCRRVITANSWPELSTELTANQRQAVEQTDDPEIVWLFTGQGSQYTGMGQSLYGRESAFTQAIDQCAQLLAPHFTLPLTDLLFSDEHSGLLNQTRYTQPALFALEYALAQQWLVWGMKPDVLLGHSVGEITAACVAGLFSLEDAITLITARGQLMQELPVEGPRQGGMVSVMAAEADILPLLSVPDVVIAAVNGPQQTVVSGSLSGLAQLQNTLESGGIDYIPLMVSHAFHSPLMEPMTARFREHIGGIQFSQPRWPLICNVTGEQADAEMASIDYWVRHILSSVRFYDSVKTLLAGKESEAQKTRLWVEMGPKPVLINLVRTIVGSDFNALACLDGNVPEQGRGSQLWQGFVQWVEQGGEPDWSGVLGEGAARFMNLPLYPFQRKYYSALRPQTVVQQVPNIQHVQPIQEVRQLDKQTTPLIYQHRVGDQVVVPGAWYIAQTIALFSRVSGQNSFALEAIEFDHPLLLPDDSSRHQVMLHLKSEGEQWRFSVENDAGGVFCRGRILANKEPLPSIDNDALKASQGNPLPKNELAYRLKRQGVNWGADWFWYRQGWQEKADSCLVEMARPQNAGEEHTPVDSALIDNLFSCGQLCLPSVEQRALVPFSVERLQVCIPAQNKCLSEVQSCDGGFCNYQRLSYALKDDGSVEGMNAQLQFYDPAGHCWLAMEGITARQATDAAFNARPSLSDLWSLVWQPLSIPSVHTRNESVDSHCRVVVIGDSRQQAGNSITRQRIVESFQKTGIPCTSFDLGELALTGEDGKSRLRQWLVEDNGHQDSAPHILLLAPADNVLSRFVPFLPHLLETLYESVQPPTLWLLTCNNWVIPEERLADDSAGEIPYPGQSLFWGIGSVMAREHPELCCYLGDLDTRTPNASLAPVEQQVLTLFRAAIKDKAPETHWLWRGQQCYGLRMAEQDGSAPPEPVPQLHKNGFYLVTGGLGDLGLSILERMADWGAGTLVTVNRNAPRSEAQALIDRLSGKGVRVIPRQADISDRTSLERLLTFMEQEHGPLLGVIHGAGALDDGILLNQSVERFERVHAAKAAGAWHLHKLTKDKPLTFFVVLSSATWLLGMPGQGNYSAANVFMDTLVSHRRGRGLPAASLCLGPVGKTSHIASRDSQTQNRQNAMGIADSSREQTLDALATLLCGDKSESGERVLLHYDPQKLAAFYHQHCPHQPLFSAFRTCFQAGENASQVSTKSDTPWPQGKPKPEAEPQSGDKRESLQQLICNAVAEILKLPAEEMDRQEPLTAQGFDSITALELRRSLQPHFQRQLPATLLFDYPSLEAMTGYLLPDYTPPQRENVEAVTTSPIEEQPSTEEPVPETAIAIIGMGCRFPGDVETPEQLWALLDGEACPVTPVPDSRWDAEALYVQDPGIPGTITCRTGFFIDGIDLFDPAFFGIPVHEANVMDPQQRIALECSWQACANAGYTRDQLNNSLTGVYMGQMSYEYQSLQSTAPAQHTGLTGTGTAAAATSGRISYCLGLRGPALTIDTACSSSLAAVDAACKGLLNHDCDMALAGGVSLMLTPLLYLEFSRLEGMSPDGICRSFGAGANGVGWGEGCGVVLLKRYQDALNDGDPILAIIRGGAVNQDGRSQQLTAPNGPSQQALVRSALERCSCDVNGLDYLETHGTGTPLGDSIEAGALAEIFAERHEPLLLGSAKSNLGHTQAAAGILGLMKVVLAMQHEHLPASLHAEERNPHIPWESTRLEVLCQGRPWPRRPGHRRRAGVSSFGLIGTNVHLIVEEPHQPVAAQVFNTEAVPFQRISCWFQPYGSQQPASQKTTTFLWQTLSMTRYPWLADHKVNDQIIVPGTLLLAAYFEYSDQPGCLNDLTLQQPLMLGADDVWEIAVQKEQQAIRITARSVNQTGGADVVHLASGHGGCSDTGSQASTLPSPVNLREMVSHLSREAEEQELADLYQMLADSGIKFGSAFHTVRQLWHTSEGGLPVAVARVALDQSMPIEGSQRVLHPLLVDGCLHAGALLINKAMQQKDGSAIPEHAIVPAAFDELRLEAATTTEVWVWVTLLETTTRSASCRIDIRDSQGLAIGAIGRALFRIQGADHAGKPCWQLDTVNKPLDEQERSLDVLPHTEALSGLFASLKGNPDLCFGPAYHDWPKDVSQNQLTSMARSIVKQALVSLFPKVATSNEWDVAEFLAEVAVVPRYHRLVEQYRKFVLSDEGYKSAELPPGPAVTLLETVGEALPDLLTGKREISDLFNHSRFRDALTALYRDTPAAIAGNSLVRRVMVTLVDNLGRGRKLQVMEVGAGTGGLTQALLPVLPPDGIRYTMTDVSPFLVDSARKQFQASGFVDAAVYDLNQPSDQQENHSDLKGGMDILIAANALHTATDLHATLLGLRQLLRPNGVLLFLETMCRIPWVETVFGLFEGWDGYQDEGLPDDSPILSAQQWQSALEQAGFDAVQTLPVDSCLPAGHGESGQAVIMARRGLQDKSDLTDRPPYLSSSSQRYWLYAPSDSSEALEQVLGKVGQTVEVWNSNHGLPKVDNDHQTFIYFIPDEQSYGSELLGVAMALRNALFAMATEISVLAEQHKIRTCIVSRGAGAPITGTGVDPIQATVTGIIRTLSREMPQISWRQVDLDPADVPADQMRALARELNAVWQDKQDTLVVCRQGHRWIHRVIPQPENNRLAYHPDNNPHLSGIKESQGNLNSLSWSDVSRSPPGAGEVEIHVSATGVNFRDLLICLGQYPGLEDPDKELGTECCGEIVRIGAGVNHIAVGQRVIALSGGSFSRYLTTHALHVCALPAGFRQDQGATLPAAFTTVWHSLVELAGINEKDHVLIHAGAGGIGLAAIQVCRLRGARFILTASSHKQTWLQSYLNSSGEGQPVHIYSSRNTAFADAILTETGGKGVSVVLNSLSAPGFIDANLRAVQKGGFFLELGKREIWTAEQVHSVRPDVRYQAVDVARINEQEPERVQNWLAEITSLIASGQLEPLPASIYAPERIVDALRDMQAGKTVGKVILDMDGSHSHPFICRPDARYLVIGGSRGLGLLIARWLIRHGARRLVLVGRHPMDSEVVESLRSEAPDADLTTVVLNVGSEPLDTLFAPDKQPYAGIFHCAGVLDNGLFLKQDKQAFERVLAPKVTGAWHIHQAIVAQPLDKRPDFCVYLSSVVSLYGANGQANHAAANSYLDQLSQWQRRQNINAISINVGPISDIGSAASMAPAVQAQMEAEGLGFLSPEDFLEQLEQILLQREQFPEGRALIINRRQENISGEDTNTAASVSKGQWSRSALEELVQREVRGILSLHEAIPSDRALQEFGLGSLLAVELCNRLARQLQIPLSTTLLFDHPTIEALVCYLSSKLAIDADNEEGNEVQNEPLVSGPEGDTGRLDDIAVISMACRLPGGVDSPEQLWQQLMAGEESVSEVPASRWSNDDWYGPGQPGKICNRRGGFLDDIEQFDPQAFGISEEEAPFIAPELRLLLETGQECLERGNYPPDKTDSTRTGVFVGLRSSEYQQRSLFGHGEIQPWSMSGSLASTMAGRLSYWLNLKGPNLPVDTACSSSLVATHLACQSLRQNECDLALAGGVNIILEPRGSAYFSTVNALSPSGHCHSFGEAADGFVRSEGCVLLLLKRMKDALGDGDKIEAVITGSAVNQDGRSQGITAPNGPAQQTVIRQSLSASGLSPEQVGYVEAHGTGTELGDPIEVEALAEVFSERSDSLLLGSIKSNIGHTETAAGSAGLLKAILCLREGIIPPSLHSQVLNPRLQWDTLPVSVVQTATDFPSSNRFPRVAGVSSFGISGTNVHLLVRGLHDGEQSLVAEQNVEPAVLPKHSSTTRKRYWLEANDVSPQPDADIPARCYQVQWQPVRVQVSSSQSLPTEPVLLLESGASQLLEAFVECWQQQDGLIVRSTLENINSPEITPAFVLLPVTVNTVDEWLDWVEQLQRWLKNTEASMPLWFLLETSATDNPAHCQREVVRGMCRGLARALACELPKFRGGVIESHRSPSASELSWLVSYLGQYGEQGADERLCLRDDGWCHLRLEASAEQTSITGFSASLGTILVVGGAGDIGRLVVQWLLDQGAQHIVIVGRSQPERHKPWFSQLNTSRVEYRQVDVCKWAEVEALVAGLNDLTSVFYLAGVYSSGLLTEQSRNDWQVVTNSKVTGALNLHRATLDKQLDAFVLFSSAVTVTGNSGQASYLAANAGLDQLAECRQRCGLPAISIGWGGWGESAIIRESSARWSGLSRDLESGEALGILSAILKAPQSDTGYWLALALDWQQFPKDWLSPVLGDMTHDVPPACPPSESTPAFLQIQQTKAELRHNALLNLLMDELLPLLPAEIRARLDDKKLAGKGLFSLGIDSLMVVAFAQKIQQLLGINFPVTWAVTAPNLTDLSERILESIDFSQFVNVSASREEAPHGEAPNLKNEPIAVVGFGCNLPGGVSDLDSLWTMLLDDQELTTDIPAERFDSDAIFSDDKDQPGKSYTRRGCFIENPGLFDAELFDLTPREAAAMDPQHRLLLLCGWRALEQAGLQPEDLKNSQTGVYLGIGPSEYDLCRDDRLDQISGQDVTGTHTSFSAGRFSYLLGLQGPSMAIDTACSSSLVAVHLAVQALRAGECDLALAGGVQLMLSPIPFVGLSRTRALSADGRCKTFSEQADGYGRGEGCVVIALRRLSTARSNGEQILAVIRGSAVNHDGSSSALTVPNEHAQVKVIQAALDNAGLKADEVAGVEAHGTGTILGDPIEVSALHRVYGSSVRQSSLKLGCIKSRIGHLESAAGLAGFAKVLACLKHRSLPPQAVEGELNTKVNWRDISVEVCREVCTFDGEEPLRLGLSSFGISGTNAHLIIESPEPQQTITRPALPPRVFQLEHYWLETERLYSQVVESLEEDCNSIAPELLPDEWFMEERKVPAPIHSLLPLPEKRNLQVSSDDIDERRGLEQHTIRWIAQTLKTMGMTASPQSSGEGVHKLADRYDIPVSQRPLFQRMLEIVQEYGDGGLLEDDATAELTPIQTPAGQLLAHCGNHLAGVLQGKVSPVEVMLGDIGRPLLESLYSSGEMIDQVIRTIIPSVREAAKASSGAPLNIVELGAGTGSLTHKIIPELVAVAEEYGVRINYLFTDVSASFIEQARRRFADIDMVSFVLLDLNQSLSDQLSEQGEGNGELFDLVLAVNVVHISAYLKRSLTSIREIVKESGLVLIVESSNPGIWTDLTFGLLEGWWQCAEDPARKGYPLLPASRWCQLLEQYGFDNGQSLMADDAPQAIITARACDSGADHHSIIVLTGDTFPQSDGYSLSFINLDEGWQDKLCTLLATEASVEISADTVDVIFALGMVRGNYRQGEELLNSSLHYLDILLQLPELLLGHKGVTPRLWLASFRDHSSAAGADRDMTEIVHHPLFCLSRVVGREYQELGVGRITFEQTEGLSDLVRELRWQRRNRGKLRAVDVLWQQGQRSQLTLNSEPASDRFPKNIQCQSDSRYLICGSGGMARLAARWLIQRGARHIVMISRNASLSDTDNQEIEAFRGQVVIEIVQASVEDLDRLTELFRTPDQPLIRGIIHCAGSLDDSVCANLTVDRIRNVLRPKLIGGLNLLQLVEQNPMDFVVFFSSASTVMSPPGLGSYVAANAALEAVGKAGTDSGLPITTIGWPAVAKTGVANLQASNKPMQRLLQENGLLSLSPDQSVACLNHLVTEDRRDCTQYVLPLEPHKWANTASPQIDNAEVPITGMSPGQQRNDLHQLIVTSLREVLRDPTRQFSENVVLSEQGLDSLLAVELRQKLVKRTGLSLSTTVLFEYPTLDMLIQHLMNQREDGSEGVEADEAAIETVVETSSEAIAIVGIGCRLPDGVEGAESFWEALLSGHDFVGSVPDDRWSNTEGRESGGFLKDIDQFDPLFFEIPPREAPWLDPQARVFMEVSWQAFEDAGMTYEQLWGSRTAVYLGIYNNDYQQRIYRQPEQELDAWSALGSEHSTLVGKLAYWLNLKGPAMPVNTACSSSLVAVSMGCEALINGSVDLALCGGVNLILSPRRHQYFRKLKALSPTGHCRTFSDDADGFVPSEGCGMVVLKRLSQAQADHDRIYGVIKGWATNQDGRSQGLTAPSGKAQEAVIQKALARAEYKAGDVGYLETHGTGTLLGDPIEVQAIAQAMERAGESSQTELILGALKSVAGHTEAAAGVLGLIKTALAMHNRRVPGNLHCHEPNSRIPWQELRVRMPVLGEPWPESSNGIPLSASVSAFGFSGTNAHIVLEPVLEKESTETGGECPLSLYLLPLSARSDQALQAWVSHIQSWLNEHGPDFDASALCAFFALKRSHFEHRAVILGRNANELRSSACSPLMSGAELPESILCCYQLTGEWPERKSQELLSYYQGLPMFAQVINLCAEIQEISPHEWLKQDDAQRLGASIELAIALQLNEWGVVPDYVEATGLGEITAQALSGHAHLESVLNSLWGREADIDHDTEETTTPRCELRLASQPQFGAETVPYTMLVSRQKSDICANDCSPVALDLSHPLQALAYWYTNGGEVNWELLYQEPPEWLNPGFYPFQRERYWIEETDHQGSPEAKADGDVMVSFSMAGSFQKE